MYLGIDLGTSFIKGAVLDSATYQVSHVYRVPFPDPIPGTPPLYREYDAGQVMAAVRAVVDALIQFADNCEGIVMCSQMHCIVFCTADGKARSNLVNWQDERGLLPHPSGSGSFYDVVRSNLDTNDIRQLGNELRPGMPIVLLSWYAEQVLPPEPGLIAASLPDFVVANLCACEPRTDLTHAAAHGLLNLETLDWHHAVINKLKLQRFRLPEIRRQGEVIGYLDLAGRSVPCFLPVGDYQSALVGTLLREDELSLNISTGSQVSTLSQRPVFGDFETRPYFDGWFTRTITHIPAGRALNALVGLLSELSLAQQAELPDPWTYIIRAAEAAGPTEMQVNLAFYNSPVGDRGFIRNIQESELTVGHLFRAAFQNMADNYYAFALRLSPEKAWNSLVLSGGLPQKISLLRALIGQKFQARYRVSPHPEDTLLGLLILATAFTGQADSVSNAANIVNKALSDASLSETKAN